MRQVSGVAASGFLFLALVFVWSPTSLGAEKVKFATQFRMNASYMLPPAAAMEKGFWQQEGLEVEWFPFGSTETMNRAIAAGAIDVGTSTSTSHVAAIAAGIGKIMVADSGFVTDFFFWVLTDSRFKKLEDLKGARIGLSRFGQSTHYYTDAFLSNQGLKRDVKVAALGGGQEAVAAMVARQVDMIIFSRYTMLPLWAEGKVRPLLRVDDYLPEGLGFELVYARKEFARKEPEAVRKIIRGFFRGANFVLNNKEWAIEKMKKEVLYSQQVAEKAFPVLYYSADGRINKEKTERFLRAAIDMLVKYNVVTREKVPSMADLYTDRFLGQ